ncbi:TPR-like protein [Lindgomyces ingoldianus]|uniref:TPR-like protein n=1 Tax=Lindgomyces ingoldianus TaxID=673940 RepID=A0ACB6RGX2_9PLEO|nr:TPR-like protein [Lindgomyces ingoldianus]KAF2477726.1 TPR-like protein [Lindgomyces ingoldianus]
MSHVHRTGLTELHSGIGFNGELPKANIVFIHGLGGHPQNTWSCKYASPSQDASSRRSSADTGSTGRKGSMFNKFLPIKRTKTGMNTGLGDRTLSIAPSTYTMDTTSESISPRESNIDPLSHEPEPIISPTMGPMNHKKVFWPRDLLPKDFPNTRILTFGYDADLVSLTTTGARAKLNFTQHAHDLLVTLNRELDDEVPIILCAHSLGGVLAKRALWESKTSPNPQLQKLANLTKVVMFFGSPHRGSSTAGWGEIGTKIASMVKLDSAQHLVSSLKLDSEILDNIHSDFMKLLIAGTFYIHTFQEGRPINNVIGKIVEDFSSKIDDATPMQIHEVIDGHHRNMIRFRTAQDSGYRKVISALKQYMNMLSKKHDIERMSIASSFSAKEMPTRTYFSVPYERNPNFVGREECLEAIDKIFSGPKKTQVAIELAYRWKQFFPMFSVFWVHATSIDRFNDGLQGILEKLEIPHSAETNVANVVEEWLRNRANGRWLLIVDNVDKEDVLDENKGKGAFKMLSCIPKTDHGHVLFTSRYKRVAMNLTSDLVRLDQMSKPEAVELLKLNLHECYDETQSTDADKLLEELSYIPLAIAQAAAYIRENENTIADYLELYQESEENRVELLEQSIAELGISDPETPKTVLTTCWMSFSRLQADGAAGPLATELLSVMSFLDRQEIPRALLRGFRPKAGSLKLNNALGILKAYSLVTENTETKNFAMHRLVQLSMRKWLETKDLEKRYSEEALTLLADSFPDGSFKTWESCKALIVHADTVLELTVDSENRSARAKLLQNCANFQNGRGQYAAAEMKFVEVVRLRTEFVGADNTDTLRAVDQLSWTLRNQAKNDEALEIAKQTLSKKEQLFSKKSAEALTTSHIVATITGDRGKHQDAAKLHEENLEARKELLGAEHLDTLRSAASLSLELWELGKFVDAENLARQTLASRTQLLGEEHPDTLEIAGTLGFILEIQGKYQEAKELKYNMLQIRQRIYGEDHPDTADSNHDMGWILHQMGLYDDAEPFYEQALKAKLRLLGETHPKTLTTMCNYPVFYCDKGEYDKAEERSKRLITVFKRVQGDMHPQTLDAMGGLAVILRHQGKLEEAAKIARTSIDGRNIVLGPDHPWTLPPVSHWGYVLSLQGELDKGEEVIRTALRSLEKAMGSEHGNVLTSLVFLSKNLLRQSTGPEDPKLEESEQLAQRALDSRKKLLGDNHPYTYKTMHHLARVLMARGRYEDAEKLARHALGGLCRTLGAEHPDVSRADEELREMEAKVEEVGRKMGDRKEGGDGEEDGKVEVIDI